jgi:hypothetical protein
MFKIEMRGRAGVHMLGLRPHEQHIEQKLNLMIHLVMVALGLC